MIKISEDDLGTLAICAIRYCQGRQTYMPTLVQGIVGQYLEELSDKDLRVLHEDCEYQKNANLYGDDTIDKPDWLKWEKRIREEIERRKKESEE